MSYDTKKSGMCIRQLRKRRGFTQEDLARKLHIDRSHLSRIESGEKGCAVDLLLQLSDLLNVTVDYLLTGSTRRELMETADTEQMKEDIEVFIRQLEDFKARL